MIKKFSTVTLSNGLKMPAMQLGTWLSKPNEVSKATEAFLRAGGPAIDCARIYGNEDEVGLGIKNSGVDPNTIWITSKLWNNAHQPSEVPKAIEATLRDLGVDHLDLYLMHWPVSFKPGGEMIPKAEDGKAILDDTSITETWAAMEKLVDEGKVKAIGLSNFNKEQTETILKSCRIKPVVAQNELHPYLAQHEFVKWNSERGIHSTAYSPFANLNPIYDKGREVEKLVENPVITKIAEKYGKTGTQIVLAWGITRGTSVAPKSVNPERIKENLGGDFKLEAQDMAEIDKLDKKLRFNDPSNAFRFQFYEGLDGYSPV